ncbi:uncharacterized protein LOC132553048 [Ylistrum balloti]|uniref:uncharacterized protein LOC132553048 n=1 Tax=Ylistrum balloti TaxID=509963 RepID=UPI002905A148|nr:uncharacterized protein LOC132553048 [Ylistrum balloti]
MAAKARSIVCAVNILSTLFMISQYVDEAEAHGSMVNPAQRSAMWAYGFNTPKNYNYNGLNCGGFVTHWYYNGGKCGLCGDSYNGERANEDGGVFATGTIAKSYLQDSMIVVKVDLSANHGGWFEFRLCARNSKYDPLTQECLNRHLLHSPEGKTRYYPGFSMRSHVISLQLPVGVTCNQCVLQWKYNAGNSWGCDQSFRCCMGCGEQEQFYNCADVEIVTDSLTSSKSYDSNERDKTSSAKSGYNSDETTTAKIKFEKTTFPEVQSTDTTTIGWIKPKYTKLNKKVYKDENAELMAKMGIIEITDMANNALQIGPTEEVRALNTFPARKPTIESPNKQRKVRCVGRGMWKVVEGMDKWCEQNCVRGISSPPSGCSSHCVCK